MVDWRETKIRQLQAASPVFCPDPSGPAIFNTGRTGIYFDRLPRLASRTPAPPPFSGMNSTPAFSSARTRAWMAILRAEFARLVSASSAWATKIPKVTISSAGAGTSALRVTCSLQGDDLALDLS